MIDLTFYAPDPRFDRAAHLRTDAVWLGERRASASTRVIALWRDQNLIRGGEAPEPLLLPADAVTGGEAIFLGMAEETAYFAVDLEDLDDAAAAGFAAGLGGEFTDLRRVGPVLPRAEAALMAYARGLAYWHRRHRFCGVCGSPTLVESAGHVRRCTGCGTSHFPRTDPAVIMLVVDGDRALLGRQSQWTPGMVSTLAGFVEPGERLEDAVAREVFEESGIRVTDVSYRASQPWPFPSSLMLGFRARAVTTEIQVDQLELEMARWFTREDLGRMAEIGFALPRPDSIARRLIEEWLAE